MRSPLAFRDLYNEEQIEPSVTVLSEMQTADPAGSIAPANDFMLISPGRSGPPRVLKRFKNLSVLQDTYDPDFNADELVALARAGRAGFGNDDVFGCADILVLRLDNATPASTLLKEGGVNLVRISTADYGSHTNRARALIEGGTNVGKRITVRDDKRVFVGDDLGVLLDLQYIGNGSAATATIVQGAGKIEYTNNPADGDKLTINGVVFEFEGTGGVGVGNVAVTIAAGSDGTFENLRQAILGTLSGVAVTLDTTNNVLTLSAPEVGLTLVETTDSGNVMSVATSFPSARLMTTVTSPTDGSVDLDIPLTVSGYKTLDKLVSFINQQIGYHAVISPYASKFIDSAGLDSLAPTNIKTAPITLTGFNAAIIDFLAHKTRGNFSGVELARGEVDEADYLFTGGTSPGTTIADWSVALDIIEANVNRGGVILPNTDDPAVLALITAWIEARREQGKFFRAVFGLARPTTTPEQALIVTGALDHSRVTVVMQRPGVFGENGAIDYLHPVHLAAVLAGGLCGNLPYVNPLTNKRLRFTGIHPDDRFDQVTRNALLSGGVTVIKQEEDITVVALHVTTSRDPIKRMVRIASEAGLVGIVEQTLREAFLSFRGRWARADMGARVYAVGGRVMDSFVDVGAICKGFDEAGNAVPAWRWVGPGWTYADGVLALDIQYFMGGELNHISIHTAAEYQRLQDEFRSGGLERLTTSIPIR